MSELLRMLDAHPALWPVFIFCARVMDVSIGTLRTILVVRGSRFLAPSLGFVEVTIWVCAISGVLTHLDRWYNIVAYASGFATGNALGIVLEQKVAIGMQAIRLISCAKYAAVAAGLRLAGYGVTEIPARGLHGDVTVAFVVVPRRETQTVIRTAARIDPEVSCTVEDVRSTNLQTYRRALPPTGWRGILKRK